MQTAPTYVRKIFVYAAGELEMFPTFVFFIPLPFSQNVIEDGVPSTRLHSPPPPPPLFFFFFGPRPQALPVFHRACNASGAPIR